MLGQNNRGLRVPNFNGFGYKDKKAYNRREEYNQLQSNYVHTQVYLRIA